MEEPSVNRLMKPENRIGINSKNRFKVILGFEKRNMEGQKR